MKEYTVTISKTVQERQYEPIAEKSAAMLLRRPGRLSRIAAVTLNNVVPFIFTTPTRIFLRSAGCQAFEMAQFWQYPGMSH